MPKLNKQKKVEEKEREREMTMGDRLSFVKVIFTRLAHIHIYELSLFSFQI
jgi:hypothetical protein